METKSFCHQKVHQKSEIVRKHLQNIGLVSRGCRELLQPNNKKYKQLNFQNKQKIINRCFTKEMQVAKKSNQVFHAISFCGKPQ